MINKYLILIGRTFIATFILVNLFNTVPFDFSNNAWYVQFSMLLVDTASLMLLGLSCLKLVSFLGIKDDNSVVVREGFAINQINSNEEQKQKYKKNIININKFSTYLFYLFIFVALLQFFVMFNGVSQINFMYSEKMLIIEKEFDKFKNKISSESNVDKEIDTQKILDSKLLEKNKVYKSMLKEANNGKFYLFRNVLKVFLMSSIWAYGFFKLANFN